MSILSTLTMTTDHEYKTLVYLLQIPSSQEKVENFILSNRRLFTDPWSSYTHKILKGMLPEYYFYICTVIQHRVPPNCVFAFISYYESSEMIDERMFFNTYMRLLNIDNLTIYNGFIFNSYSFARLFYRHINDYDKLVPGYINNVIKPRYIALTKPQRSTFLNHIISKQPPLELLKIILSFGFEKEFTRTLCTYADRYINTQICYPLSYIHFVDYLASITTMEKKSEWFNKIYGSLLLSRSIDDQYTTILLERINQHGGFKVNPVYEQFSHVRLKPILLMHIGKAYVNDKECCKNAKELIYQTGASEQTKRVLISLFNINTKPARDIKQRQREELEICDRLDLPDDLVTVIKTLL